MTAAGPGLDATHLGTALHARQALTSFVTYDKWPFLGMVT